MTIRVAVFDPHTASAALWAALHVARREISAELWPDEPILDDAETETEIRRGAPLMEIRRWLAMEGDEVVGSARASFRRPDTPNAEEHAPFLWAGGSVRARWRRRGIGTSLLGEVRDLMHALDKRVLTLSSDVEAGHAFIARVGAAEKHSTVQQRADVARIDWRRLREWEDGPAALGLTWERYRGRVPRDVLVSLLPAFTELAADVPLGALETAPIRFEIEGYDLWYETMDRVGGAHHLALLRQPDGAVVAVSEAGVDARTPGFAGQHITAVARAWRGKGLARAAKAALMRQVHEEHPEVAVIETSNAKVNAPILSINERLGFKVAYRNIDYQVTRDELDAWARRVAG